MSWQRIQKFFRSRQNYRAVAFFLAGILISPLPDLVMAGGIFVVIAIALIAVAAWVISLLLPHQPIFDVLIKSPQTIRSPSEEQRYARKVFIGFVPLLKLQGDNAKAFADDADRKEAIENLDFDRLKLEESNFKPTIHAITSHKDRLEHCWLLTTAGIDPDAVGSRAYVELLVEYLKQHYGLTCHFHYGDRYTISLDEDSQVLSKTYDLVQQAFREIPSSIAPREVVADISTGFRSMTLGMVLACLDEERDIEFVGTRYNKDGKPDRNSPLVPIIFSFKPNLRGQR